MADSIRNELEQLESVGRVSVRGARKVHAEFGFAEIEPDVTAPSAPVVERDVVTQLDEAWSRLKSRIAPE